MELSGGAQTEVLSACGRPTRMLASGYTLQREIRKAEVKENVFTQTQLVPQWSQFRENSKRGRGRRNRIPDGGQRRKEGGGLGKQQICGRS